MALLVLPGDTCTSDRQKSQVEVQCLKLTHFYLEFGLMSTEEPASAGAQDSLMKGMRYKVESVPGYFVTDKRLDSFLNGRVEFQPTPHPSPAAKADPRHHSGGADKTIALVCPT